MSRKRPRILVFFGLIASGKSTLGKLFADRHDYLYLNTDRVRKELAGIASTRSATAAPDQGIYTGAFSEKTYAEMLSRAKTALLEDRAGVVLDGSYVRKADRRAVVRMAADCREAILFVFCTCRPDTVRERLQRRAHDPLAVSDGNWEIYQHQLANFKMPDELAPEQLVVLKTENPPEQLLDDLEHWLTAPRSG